MSGDDFIKSKQGVILLLAVVTGLVAFGCFCAGPSESTYFAFCRTKKDHLVMDTLRDRKCEWNSQTCDIQRKLNLKTVLSKEQKTAFKKLHGYSADAVCPSIWLALTGIVCFGVSWIIDVLTYLVLVVTPNARKRKMAFKLNGFLFLAGILSVLSTVAVLSFLIWAGLSHFPDIQRCSKNGRGPVPCGTLKNDVYGIAPMAAGCFFGLVTGCLAVLGGISLRWLPVAVRPRMSLRGSHVSTGSRVSIASQQQPPPPPPDQPPDLPPQPTSNPPPESSRQSLAGVPPVENSSLRRQQDEPRPQELPVRKSRRSSRQKSTVPGREFEEIRRTRTKHGRRSRRHGADEPEEGHRKKKHHRKH